MQIKKVINLEGEIVKAFSDDDYNNFVYETIKPDSILEKIHQFTFNPPLELGPSSYPAHLKKQELEKLTTEDWKYFFQKYYVAQGLNKSCFKFFKYRFEVLAGFIKFLTKFADTTISWEDILQHVGFYKRIDYGDQTGVKKICTEVGKYWPFLWLEYWYSLDRKIILKEECHFHWLMRRPNDEELKKESLRWEIHAIEMYELLKDFREYENITFGADSKTEYRIYHFFKGKKLQTSKSKYLSFSLAKKYGPLLNRMVQNAINKHLVEWPFDFHPRLIKMEILTPGLKKHEAIVSFEKDKEAFKYSLYEEFKEEILAWAKNRVTDFPAQYFKLNLQGFITKLFRSKDHSTTTGEASCCPEKIDDWYHCRYKTPKDDLDSPDCKYRNGVLCYHSEAKRVRIEELYSNMKTISPNGSIVEKWEDEDGEQVKKTYPDSLVIKETNGELKDVLSHVASDGKDGEILFLLFKFGHSNYSEIGRSVGLSDNAVRKRL